MWLQVHLLAWAVASVWGAGVEMGVAWRPGNERQDMDTRGQPTFATDHRRLTPHTSHRFRADANHRFRTATDGRGTKSRKIRTWGDVRRIVAEPRRAEEARNQARRAQVGNRRSHADGGLTNRYRFGSEASATRSRSHRLLPEASQASRRYSRVDEIEGEASPAPHTRRYYWIVSEAPPRMPTQSQERQDGLRYSEAHTTASRSFPGNSLTSPGTGSSIRLAFHTPPPGRRLGESRASESSHGANDDPNGVHGTSQGHAPLQEGGERTPFASPVSQDLHVSGRDPPHQEAESQREAPPDWCCGSSVPLDHENAISVGGLSRVASAGSVKVVGVPPLDKDFLPPFTVRDLRVIPLDSNTVSLTWTAPGDDLDSGIASSYVIRMSDTIDDLKESRFDLAPDATLLDVADLLAASDVYRTSGTEVSVRTPLTRPLRMGHVYFMALRALDDVGNASPVSNVARFSLPRPMSDDPSGHATTTTTAEEDDDDDDDLFLLREEQGHDKSLSGRSDDVRVSSENAEPGPTSSLGRRPEESGPDVSLTEELPPPSATVPSETVSGDLATGTPGDRDLNAASSEPDQNHLSRRGRKRKSRKNKKERKAKKNRRYGKKNRRRKDKRRRQGREEEEEEEGESSETEDGTYSYGNGECHIDEAHEGTISLCDARYSLAIVIAYFEQNADYRHMDYLWAAMHSLNQRTRPPWQRERRSSRGHGSGGRRSRA